MLSFMQRGKVAVQNKLEEVDRQHAVDESHWEIPGISSIVKKETFIFDTSYVKCEDLLPIGRMSFMNYNPGTEKTYKEVLARQKLKASTEKEDFDGISDDEMARRYETLVDTIAKKFQKKRKVAEVTVSSDSDTPSGDVTRNLLKRKKPKFLKPKED